MNELSPRRFPRSPTITPPRWKKPEDVMRKRKIRLKESALIARINKSPRHEDDEASLKRKNPFSRSSQLLEPNNKKLKVESETIIGEDSLLEILGFNSTQPRLDFIDDESPKTAKVTQSESQSFVGEVRSLRKLPLDWTLRTKMRFISVKPFPWSLTLKTCDEASGITGFVRCLDWSRSEPGVDTTPNGRFHQSCLVWVQPNLPWLEVFPRHNLRRIGKSSTTIASPNVKEALHKDWANSFRSLFQLVRARHCPYFYLVANTFTCLFRSAGINGVMETTASICPTTKGFRKLLSDEGITFSLPLRNEKDGRRSSSLGGEEDEAEEELVEEDKTEDNDWFASLGIQEAEIFTIRDSQEKTAIIKEEKSDGVDESLVRVDGCEAHALFNFLINCKSVVATTGPLSGVPPTLLAPVAFPGGTLTPLKVCENTVNVDGERYYTMEVRGPILPNNVFNLTSLLEEELDTFSVTLANVDPTKALTLVRDGESDVVSPRKQTQAFSQGGLSDSGLDSKLLSTFCSVNLKPFDSIKYTNGYHIS